MFPISKPFRVAACAFYLAFLMVGGQPGIASTVDVGLLGEYPLLQDGQDLSANHRDIIAPAAVGFAATGPIAGAELTRARAVLQFAGYKPYVGPAPEPFYQGVFEPGSSGYTVSGWIFVNAFAAPPVGGAKPVDLAQYPRGNAFAGFWVERQSHQVAFVINSARLSLNGPDSVQDAGPVTQVISNASIEQRQWVHVAISVDLATKSYALYINGRLDKKGAVDILTVTYLKNIYLLSPSVPESTARAAMSDETASSILNGTVRDITIHNRALAPDEIVALASPDPDVIAQHAPLIYLHPDERFMPSSLEFLAQNVHLECDGARVNKDIVPLPGSTRPVLQATDFPSWQAESKPDTDDSRCALTTNLPMNDGPYTILPFFAGETPSAAHPVPVYVFTYDISSRTSFTAQYTTFYPYNQGKMACPLFAPADNCLAPSGRKEVDDHVGDWELMSIRYVGGEPVEVHIGAHGNDEPETATTFVPVTAMDASISWSRKTDGSSTATDRQLAEWLLEAFGFFKTSTHQNGGDLQWQDGHPIVYSASGSHGVWATAGKHVYQVVLGDQLTDHTAKGTPWETWRSLGFANEPRYQVMLLDYKGDWGNGHAGKSVCDYILDTVNGPGGSILLRTVAGLLYSGNPCDLLQAAAGAYSDGARKNVETVNHLYQLNCGPQLKPQRDRKYLMVPIYGN